MTQSTTDISNLLAHLQQSLAVLHDCVKDGMLTTRESALVMNLYDSWVTITGDHPQYVPDTMDTEEEPKVVHSEPPMTAAQWWELFANSLDTAQYAAYDNMMNDPELTDQQLFRWSKANLNEQQYILFVHAVEASTREK